MTPEQAHNQRKDALVNLAYANLQRAACLEAYRTALLAAHQSGATYTEIGRTLAISRQSARQLIMRCPR